MVTLFGKTYTQRELLAHVGSLSQVGGVREMAYQEGTARGARVAQFETGTGLAFNVLLDRGMDIGAARYRGAALAWEAAPGPAHPAYHERQGLGWLRTFHGGLVTGCGLTTAGAPAVDQGEPLGLHGRLSHLPAEGTWVDGTWRNDGVRGDAYEMWARGRMRQAVVFGENVTLTRRVWAYLGESRLFIRDVVVNEGHATVPHMLLYHCNFGWPLVDEGTRLVTPARSVTSRDPVAEAGIASHSTYEGPTAGYAEQVFYHDMLADDAGFVTAMLANRRFDEGRGIGAYLRYRRDTLPRFSQWKQVGQGDYVTGLEPANCLVEGRDKERERGTLQFLEPGEAREYLLEIGVLDGLEAIDALAESIEARA
jgi:hypothetical protein